MFNLLNYQHKRALQICIVFTVTLMLQKTFHYKHAGWIGFFVMVIYAGFEAGSSVQRIVFRFLGTIYGLVLSYLLWFITQWHGDLLIFVISIVFFCAFFFAGKAYTIPTIFTVTLTTLGTEYYSSPDYPTVSFFFDYFRSAAIALFICIFFEYLIFSKANLSEKFYHGIQRELLDILHNLHDLVVHRPLKYRQFLKLTMQSDAKTLELKRFLQTINFDLVAKYKKSSTQNENLDLFAYKGLIYHPLEAAQTFSEYIEQLNFNLHNMAFASEQKLEKLSKETLDILEHIEGLHKTLVNNSKNQT